MLRFLAALFKLDYKACETCEVLKERLAKYDEHQDSYTCDSCDTLLEQLNHALGREKELLDRLLQLTEPEVIPTQPVHVGPVLPKTRSFREAARIREEQDRVLAAKMSSKLREITELEKDLKIPGTEAEAIAEVEQVELTKSDADDSTAREA